MHEFTLDEARRWDAWQQANAVSSRRSGVAARIVGIVMIAAVLVALAVALWR